MVGDVVFILGWVFGPGKVVVYLRSASGELWKAFVTFWPIIHSKHARICAFLVIVAVYFKG